MGSRLGGALCMEIGAGERAGGDGIPAWRRSVLYDLSTREQARVRGRGSQRSRVAAHERAWNSASESARAWSSNLHIKNCATPVDNLNPASLPFSQRHPGCLSAGSSRRTEQAEYAFLGSRRHLLSSTSVWAQPLTPLLHPYPISGAVIADGVFCWDAED